MFDPAYITKKLALNADTFRALFADTGKEEYLWKPAAEKWNLLEVVCHLHDEEREDFRARLMHVLENNSNPLPSIDPQGWVKSRVYADRDYNEMVEKFLEERKNSIQWLQSLAAPQWDNAYIHPKFGPMAGKLFLSNWLAHDYLHFRQITGLKHGYLKASSGEDLQYAGNW